MGKKILLNLLLNGLKQALGKVDLQNLLDKLFKAVVDGQPAKLVVGDDGVKVVGEDGQDLSSKPLQLTVNLND